ERRIQSPRRRGAGNAAHRGHGVREHLAAARWPPDRGKGRRRRLLARVVRAEPGRALRRRRGDRRRRSRGGPLGVPQGAEWPAMAPSRRRRLQRARRESRGEAGVREGLNRNPKPKSKNNYLQTTKARRTRRANTCLLRGLRVSVVRNRLEFG